eukprot:365981-Chlamydomonas_euryale.AAC.16
MAFSSSNTQPSSPLGCAKSGFLVPCFIETGVGQDAGVNAQSGTHGLLQQASHSVWGHTNTATVCMSAAPHHRWLGPAVAARI